MTASSSKCRLTIGSGPTKTSPGGAVVLVAAERVLCRRNWLASVSMGCPCSCLWRQNLESSFAVVKIPRLSFIPKYNGCCRSRCRSDTVRNIWTVPTDKVYHASTGCVSESGDFATLFFSVDGWTEYLAVSCVRRPNNWPHGMGHNPHTPVTQNTTWVTYKALTTPWGW
jgi:hypothetical protein